MLSRLKKRQSAQVDNQWMGVFKSVIYAVTCSLMLILLFAILIWIINIPESFILPINQVIKVISLFVGCYIGLKNTKNGLINGFIIGAFYSVISFAIFSFLCNQFTLGLTTFTDILFSTLIGSICGMLAVNFNRNN